MRSTIGEWIDASLPASNQVLRLLDGHGAPSERPWPAVHRSSLCRAKVLRHRLGVQPGDRVALLGPTTVPLVETLLATWLAGATAVVLPLPLRFSGHGSFVASTRARILEAGARVVFVDPAHAAAPMADAFPQSVRTELLAEEPATGRPADPVPIDPGATAILQFTSGSTGGPKAVRLSHRAVTANIRAMREAAAFSPADRFISWLPLYHDMGLIGTLLCPTMVGAGLTLLPTGTFMAAPHTWMRAVDRYRGTITAGPNFAFALAARLLARSGTLDLSSLRAAFCGAEPIDPSTLAAVLATGRRHGLREDVVVPCYGMAETTLAISFAPLGRPVRVDVVDRAALQERRSARPVCSGGSGEAGATTAAFVALGPPLPGTAVRVVGTGGRELGEREVGELHVASSSLMDGYLNHPDAPTTAAGWLPTGDLGYLADGEVHVCGRTKDLIIVNGHNIHPHEVEAAAETVPGVRTGGTVAFAVEGTSGTEAVVVLCESAAAAEAHQAIATEVRRRVGEAVGVHPRDVRIIRPKQVPKTTSGKRQRQRARELFRSGRLGSGGREPVRATP